MRERKEKSIFVGKRNQSAAVVFDRIGWDPKKTSKRLMPPLDSFVFHKAIR